MRIAYRALVLSLLAAHTGLLAWGGSRHSPAVDEVGHFAAGLSHWGLGRFELYAVNPPLVRAVATLPVYLSEPSLTWGRYHKRPDVRSEFAVGGDLIAANGPRTFRLFAIARLACVPFSLLGGIVCWRWATDLYGARAGIASLALWCFSPTVISNAHMITPDTGAAALGAASCYLYWRWLKRPSWARALTAGFVLGLAELTKMSLIILFPLWLVSWAVWNLMNRPAPTRRAWRRQALQLMAAQALALYLINTGYGFEGSFRRLGSFEFVSSALGGRPAGERSASRGHNRFAGHWTGSIPVPLPENYVAGIDIQKRDFESRFPSYLRGEWRRGGWWYYYLYAMAVKVPLGTWAVAILAFVSAMSRRRGLEARRDEMVLLLPAATLVAFVSSQTGFNHHFRYVLPAFAFGFIWISQVFEAGGSGRIVLPAAGALACSIASTMSVYPHTLSYFNELVGGPRRGPEHLLDSNIDWGQDLLHLKRWLDDHPEAAPLHLAYYGAFDPRVAGIEPILPPEGPRCDRADALASPSELGPRPGWFAVSVNVLRGYEVWLQGNRGMRGTPEQPRFTYFQSFRPIARAGYSIYIYRITIDEANAVRRSMGLPPFSDRSIESGRPSRSDAELR